MGAAAGTYNPTPQSQLYNIDLDAGQKVSLLLVFDDSVVTSASLAIYAPGGGAPLASANSPTSPILLQSVAAATFGAYQVSTTNIAGSGAANYTLQLLLNAEIEEEAYGGPANGTIATAQAINASEVALPTSGGNRLAASGSLDGADADFFSFDLIGGDTSTIILASPSPNAVTLDLFDSAGTLLATGLTGATNVNTYISDFVAPLSDTYAARVTGDTGADYQIVVTRASDFSLAPNFMQPQAQDIARNQKAVGSLTGSGPGSAEYFRFRANAGDRLTIPTATPGDGPGEPVNDLDPLLELIDTDGTTVLASDDNSAPDGRNAQIGGFNAPATGEYFLRVSSAGGAPGDYTVEVTGATGSGSTAPEATGVVPGAAPPILPPSAVTLSFSEGLDLTSVDPTDLVFGAGTGATVNSVTVVDGQTLAFDVTVPPFAQVVDYSVAAGAVKDLQFDSNLPFAGTFTVTGTTLIAPVAVTSETAGTDLYPASQLVDASGLSATPTLVNPVPGGDLMVSRTTISGNTSKAGGWI